VGQILYMSIMFTMLSVFLIGLYGASIRSVDMFTTMAQINSPWPTVSTGKCQFSSAGLSGSCNILDAVELGGVWIFAVIGSVLFRVGALFYLGYQFFVVLNMFSSFPYLGWFFGTLMVIMVLEFWKLFRSGHTS
jgi:hypothetical protein